MTSHERMEKTFSGEPVDHPAVTPILMAYAARFIGSTYRDYYLDHRVLVESYLRCREAFGFDMLMVISDPFRETEAFGGRFDYPPDSIPVPRKLLLETLDALDALSVPDPLLHQRMADRVEAVALFRKEVGYDIPVLGWVEGPLAEAADLRGVQNLMMDVLDQPENVKTLMDLCVESGLRFARAQVDAGADIIGVGDAAVSMTSPRTYQELILPFEQRLFQGIHDMGARVKLHICGNTTALLPLMAQSGADIIDLDWMVDLALARRQCGPSVVLCGNVDPVSVVLQGSPAEIRQKSIECFQQAGMPFILSAGCEIPVSTPEENLKALCESVLELG